MTARTTIYLVDDQSIIRAVLRQTFERNGRFRIVGENGDPRRAIVEIATVRPHVVLLDVAMPGLSGIDALPLIAAVHPAGVVVMVSDHEEDSVVSQALARGARGYISKAEDPGTFEPAVLRILAGERYVSPRCRPARPG